ncbi:MAG: cytochrome c, partial [gamma proteobacterium symbiont of Ctena orbiculata]
PLTPAKLQGKPVEFITATILYGRAGTPMPPWRPFLSDGEAAWLAGRIKEGVQ